ncbi:MAG: hypothetical protein Q4C05_08055 [Akkermansia sp.]|nr:hypothetical protein [Akkermansia sp.]
MSGYIIMKNTKNLFTNYFIDLLILVIVSMFIYLCLTKPILFNPMEYVCSHLHKARSHLTDLKEKHILHNLRTDIDLYGMLKYQKEFKKQFLFIENCIFQTENTPIHYPLSLALCEQIPDIEKSGLKGNHGIYESIFNDFISIMEEHIENYPKQLSENDNYDDDWAIITLKCDCKNMKSIIFLKYYLKIMF